MFPLRVIIAVSVALEGIHPDTLTLTVLIIVTVANRIHYPYLALNNRPLPAGSNFVTTVFWRAFFWRDERMTLLYDCVGERDRGFPSGHAAGLAARPTATGMGLWAWLAD